MSKYLYPKGLLVKNRPQWKDAPKWAKWLALDDNGRWFWYSQMPECFWLLPGGRGKEEYAGEGPKHFGVREGRGMR